MGAGNVARVHANALSGIPGVEVAAVCDKDETRAHVLARELALEPAFTSVDAAIASGSFNFAHVLIPPEGHTEVARELARAGIAVFVEKPMGISQADCESLVREASDRGVRLGVNHNAVFFPAYVKLRRRVKARALGPLQHLAIVLNYPRQTLPPLSHWLFARPQNLVYESAVHPFSQVYDLAGPLRNGHTTVSGRGVGPDDGFFDTWQVSLVCEDATAQVCVSYAGAYSTWQVIAICEDGILTADLARNRFTAEKRSRWGRYDEALHVAVAHSAHELMQAVDTLQREVSSALRRNARRDPYSTSMKESIAAFHHRPPPNRPDVDGRFATGVVAICDVAAQAIEGR